MIEKYGVDKLIPQYKMEKIFFKCNGSIIGVNKSDITHIEAMKDYVRIFVLDGQKYITHITLDKIHQYLKGDFLRVHRSFVINANNIECINDGIATMANGFSVIIGEKFNIPLLKYLKVINKREVMEDNKIKKQAIKGKRIIGLFAR